MRKYDFIVFDLDGTITEPALGITNAIIYALSKYNMEVKERSELYKFIGPPLRDSFQKFYGFDEDKAEEAVRYYREYYSVHGLVENQLMPGIKQCLEDLKQAGCKLFVATSKPEEFAVKILKNLDVLKYFDIVAGAAMDGSRDKKELVMEYLFQKIKCRYAGFELDNAVMVGDRMFDINGANYFGMDSIGVTFGYGDRAELEDAGATIVVDDSEGLKFFIIGNN